MATQFRQRQDTRVVPRVMLLSATIELILRGGWFAGGQGTIQDCGPKQIYSAGSRTPRVCGVVVATGNENSILYHLTYCT